MKNIYIASGILAISMAGCTTAHLPVSTPEINTKVKDERASEMLLGHCSRSCLLELPFKEWFLKNYADYTVDSVTAEKLIPLLKDKTIVVFMGTWCGDSRREVPRFIKLLDHCGVPEFALKLVMVDYRDGAYKQSPQHEERGKNIFRVPTILLYSGTKELGRIIEFPKENLEKDLLRILNGEKYQPNYGAGQLFLEKIEKNAVYSLTIDSNSIQRDFTPGFRNSFELNSIGHVLLDQGKKQKALSAFQLNTQVFPSATQSWNGLATAYLSLGRKQEARLAVDRGLRLDASNAETKRLSQLAQ